MKFSASSLFAPARAFDRRMSLRRLFARRTEFRIYNQQVTTRRRASNASGRLGGSETMSH
jgi:hypothetical protein